MNNKEDFEMYAINVNSPYILAEENLEQFIENSKKQQETAAKLGSVFGEECFDFSLDENGLMGVELDVERKD